MNVNKVINQHLQEIKRDGCDVPLLAKLTRLARTRGVDAVKVISCPPLADPHPNCEGAILCLMVTVYDK